MKRRKIILNLCTSLDFFIEGAQGEIDWCFIDQDYSMTEFLARIDTILFGRKSYEQLIELMPDGFPGKERVVCTRNPDYTVDGVRVIPGDLPKSIEMLTHEPGKDIWLFGGSDLAQSMLANQLIDEMMISVHPLLLGQGKPLFPGLTSRVALHLTDCRTFSTGLVQLFYSVVKS
ncbi:MAG: dihydrofolate reductase [Saprospiraceae bacterium]|nr:dihydrofolate reductase [Saprospiraceae bacterium]